MIASRAPIVGREMQAAIDELVSLILIRYPGTTFSVEPSPDERDAVHLRAVVDVDDTDEVIDLVIDRTMELLIEQRLPIYVVPVRTPARQVAHLQTPVVRGSDELGD